MPNVKEQSLNAGQILTNLSVWGVDSLLESTTGLVQSGTGQELRSVEENSIDYNIITYPKEYFVSTLPKEIKVTKRKSTSPWKFPADQEEIHVTQVQLNILSNLHWRTSLIDRVIRGVIGRRVRLPTDRALTVIEELRSGPYRSRDHNYLSRRPRLPYNV